MTVARAVCGSRGSGNAAAMVLAKGKVAKNPRKVAASQKPTKLRKSITPGTVLILLAGRFRGRRVVCLKQLKSGLLLVTGPYAVNGVPLKRVNQRFVIATSTKVDVAKVKADKVTDAFFARDASEKKKKKAKSEEGFFAGAGEEKRGLSDEKKAEQKAVDGPIAAALKDDMKAYLKARFSLHGNQYPHVSLTVMTAVPHTPATDRPADGEAK